MTDSRVAFPYAKSLLDFAIEKGILDEIYQDMVMFGEVCQQNRNFVLTLKNPIINHEKKKAILHSLFKDKVTPATLVMFDIITRKNREAHLPAIAAEFGELYRKQKGIIRATVITTFPLTDELREKFKKTIKEQTGKQIDLIEKVDSSLIGGFVVKIGDKQMDNSVRSKLKSLLYEFSDDSYVKTF